MRRSLLSYAALAALLACLLAPSEGAKARKQIEDDIQKAGPHGRIDWTQGAIYATGLGAVPRNVGNDAVAYLKARDYANLDAMRNLLMAVEQVHIDARTVGADYMATSSKIRAEVEGLLRGPRIVSERKIRVGRDSMVEVTVCTPMYGDRSVASVLLPEAERREAGEEKIRPEPLVGDSPPPAADHESLPPPDTSTPPPDRGDDHPAAPENHYHVRPAPDETPEQGGVYTSVIIDARGFQVTRDMSPKIRRRDGSEVWGTVDVNPTFAIEHGIVIYAHSIAEARQLSRAGSHPLVLHAVADSDSPAQTDVVISDDDADQLLNLNARDGFLNHFNVIFVVDPLR